MPNIIKTGGGASGELSGTAQTGDVLKGKSFYNTTDEKLIGTLELTGNATTEDVLQGKTFYNTDAEAIQTGAMVPRQWGNGKNIAIWNGGVHIQNIEEGLYRGGGPTQPEVRVDAALLGDSGSDVVLNGRTFSSSNGIKMYGTMTDMGAWGETTYPGAEFTIPKGYHNGQGRIIVNSVGNPATLNALGFTNVPGGNWVIKSGSLTANQANSNPNIIPLELYISADQLAGSPISRVFYGNKKLLDIQVLNGNNWCHLFCGTDLIKQQIRVENVHTYNVVKWLEKVGG